ncbi:hypothetical protein JW968_04880 [Candidatus Woesearchaeota archaeon]|nr:hypothetical protein [Candidatus Woesearchaeota archaeon]
MKYSNLYHNPANMGHQCPLLTMKIADPGEPMRGDVERADWHPDIQPGCREITGAVCYLFQAYNGQPRIEKADECPILQKAKDLLC